MSRRTPSPTGSGGQFPVSHLYNPNRFVGVGHTSFSVPTQGHFEVNVFVHHPTHAGVGVNRPVPDLSGHVHARRDYAGHYGRTMDPSQTLAVYGGLEPLHQKSKHSLATYNEWPTLIQKRRV